MTEPPAVIATSRVRTPRAAAIAGIAFSILFASSTILTKWAVPPGSDDAGDWVGEDSRRSAVSLGLGLLPFAGIAFLWFIGVLRDRIGDREDRFFATVFLGSGLLFVAMYFAAGAVAVGLIGTAADAAGGSTGPVWPFGRRVAANLAFTYGLRMAAVFTISTTTLASRLDLIPRWLALAGYATAAVLLFGVGFLPWLDVIFPAWVFALSAHILVVTFRTTGADV